MNVDAFWKNGMVFNCWTNGLKPSNVPVLVIEENQEKPIVDGLCSPLGEAQGWWKTSGLDPRMTIVSMGNPHVVLYCRNHPTFQGPLNNLLP